MHAIRANLATPGSEKFSPALKHINLMFASRRARIGRIRDPIEFSKATDELRTAVLAAKQALIKFHPIFEDIVLDEPTFHDDDSDDELSAE